MQKQYTPQEIDALVMPLFESMRSRVTDSEMSLMIKAYNVAKEAHAPQRRKSGEPYIIHPIAVARIVGEEMHLDPYTVCAAFLHDVVEDTPYTVEQVRENFGDRVAFLVEAVTKTSKTTYETSKQVDNFKHMLDALDHDICALFLKLADRLHNMRTLNSMAPAKQMKIAGETDFFYAPLALRLGLYKIKTELENLSFRYRCPREYATIEEQLLVEKEAIRPYLEEFRDVVLACLRSIGVKADVELITRHPYSIHQKMLIKNSDFYHLQRIHSVHIVFDPVEGESEKSTAVRIYEALTNQLKEKPHSVTNYIDNPKENGYQSLHVHLLAPNGHWQETRISSRRMAAVQTLGCIASGDDSRVASWLDRLRHNIHDMAEHKGDFGFMDGVRASFYNDDIVAYTLDGVQVVLPVNASAIDFAFEVLGDEAIHAKYAHINGKLRPMNTRLERGDIVDVRTDPSAVPLRSWANNVLTYKARRALMTYRDSLPKPKLVRCQHCLPLPGDETIGFRMPDGTTMVHKRSCPVVISQASQHGDNVVPVDYANDGTPYLVNFRILAVDRYHLLIDIIDCITERLHLSIDSLKTVTRDHIVECLVNFYLYSYDDLQTAILTLNSIPGVEEVSRASEEMARFQ